MYQEVNRSYWGGCCRCCRCCGCNNPYTSPYNYTTTTNFDVTTETNKKEDSYSWLDELFDELSKPEDLANLREAIKNYLKNP